MRRALVSPSAVLFTCLFAGQSAVLVLSPILTEVAASFSVSTAVAGQLRTLSGVCAGLAALALGRVAQRFSLRGLLLLGTGMLALGSVLSATAPVFAVLVLAQLPIGLSLALLISTATAAAADWAAPGRRTTVLSWALIGQPASWIVGMPLIGLAAEVSWRLSFVVVPLVAALVAGGILLLCEAGPPDLRPAARPLALLRDPEVGAWAAGELFAYAAWGGTLVYAGALLIDSYGISTAATGLLLGAAAVCYLPGNFAARRLLAGNGRGGLIGLAVAAAGVAVAFGMARPSVAVSVGLLGGLAVLNGARTLFGSAFGLDVGADRKLAVMGIRAAATQFGYLVGAAAGGGALAAGGYRLLGPVLGVLFLGAAAPHVLRLATAGEAASEPA